MLTKQRIRWLRNRIADVKDDRFLGYDVRGLSLKVGEFRAMLDAAEMHAPDGASWGPGTNSGHGHVWKRPDGMVARCGGPGFCGECARDFYRLHRQDET